MCKAAIFGILLQVYSSHVCNICMHAWSNERNHRPLALSANEGVTESALWVNPGPYSSSPLPYLGAISDMQSSFEDSTFLNPNTGIEY